MTSTAMTVTSYSDAVSDDGSGRSHNTDNARLEELLAPPPTSVTLVAALMLLDTPLAPRPSRTPNGNRVVLPRNDEYVFLLTRKYLQNWLCWAYHQPVLEEESERVKRALQMAASIHKLTPPSESSTYHEPGPIDSTPLSVLGHPLLLRPYVIVERTENGDSLAPSDIAGGIPMGKSHSFSNLPPAAAEKDNGDGVTKPPTPEDGGQVRCCAVPERFYELLRSFHGVQCNDGFSVSFQAFVRSRETSVAVHHHVLTSPASKGVGGSPGRNTAPVDQPRPVEFRRKVIFTLASPQTRVTDVLSPISKLMHEEKSKIPRICAVVELYPIKFLYSVVGGDMDGSKKPASPANSTTQSEVPNFPASPINRTHNDTIPDTNGKNNSAAIKANGQNMSSSAPSSPQLSNSKPPLGLPRESNRTNGGSHPLPQSGDVDDQYPPIGFVLVSRTSLVADAMQAVIKEVAPNKSSTCVRVWIKRDCPKRGDGEPAGATVDGDDDYEVVHLDAINGTMFSRDKSTSPEKPSITVADWVKRQTGHNANTVSILVEIRASPSTPWTRAAQEFENRIKVGDYVDAQDTAGNWFESVVRKVTDDTVTVHYAGWASRWDTTLRRRNSGLEVNGKAKDVRAPAPLWTHTSRWRENIEVGQAVEVREAASLMQRPRWFRGIVREVGKEVDLVRETVCGAELENNDEDSIGVNGNIRKKRPLLLLKRKRQVLVEVPQEKNNNELAVASSALQSTSGSSGPPPQQFPDLRWVYLYGEEICKVGTHLRVEDDSNRPATLDYLYDTSKPPVEVLKSYNNIHGAGFVRESLRGVPPAPGSVGLHNLGNSCFLNSIIQCLNHSEPLTQYFLKGNYVKDLNRKNPLGSGGRVAVAYASLLSEIWGGEYSTLAPRTLKQTIGYFAPQFNNVHQHDSQEFCSYLMDGIHEDLNRVTDKPYVEELEGRGMKDGIAAVESWKKHLLRHDSIIVDHCQGMHRSHLTCPICGRESVKFDVYSTIPLPLPPDKGEAVDLKDCLEMFTVGEQLDEQNAWYCPSCKRHVCALKMIALWSVPDILILHLKRFTFDTCKRSGGVVRSKVEDTVKFPIEDLDLSDYILGPVDKDAPPIYKLFGVSEHSGSTANSGHYTATVRNSKDGKWYRYNDSHVGSTSGEASVTGGAYLLFYQRSKGLSRWAGMERAMINRTYDDVDEDGFTQVKSKKKNKKKSPRH